VCGVERDLLADIFRQQVDAAIVVSNDSDLALPLSVARTMVPVGTVNPGTKQLAGAPTGDRNEGPPLGSTTPGMDDDPDEVSTRARQPPAKP
jgi:hypothetical protein